MERRYSQRALRGIDWPEQFGLVMIEAMACATPVIAFDRGSVREVIDFGVTGCATSSCLTARDVGSFAAANYWRVT